MADVRNFNNSGAFYAVATALVAFAVDTKNVMKWSLTTTVLTISEATYLLIPSVLSGIRSLGIGFLGTSIAMIGMLAAVFMLNNPNLLRKQTPPPPMYDVGAPLLQKDLSDNSDLSQAMLKSLGVKSAADLASLKGNALEKGLENISNDSSDALYSHLSKTQRDALATDAQGKALLGLADTLAPTGVKSQLLSDTLKSINQKIVTSIYGNAVKTHVVPTPPSLPKPPPPPPADDMLGGGSAPASGRGPHVVGSLGASINDSSSQTLVLKLNSTTVPSNNFLPLTNENVLADNANAVDSIVVNR